MITLSALLQSAFDWTWKTSLAASILTILVLLLQTLLRRWLTPRLRYTLSFLVLCRLLMPLAPSSSLSLANVFKPTTQLAHFVPRPTIASGSIPGSVSLVQEHRRTPGTALCMAWFCGLLILSGLGIGRYCQWKRLIGTARQVSDGRLLQILDGVRQELGIRRSVTVASLPRLGSPAVFGFWRVHLLLPQTTIGILTEQEWRLVFLHEMTHIRNQDTVLNAILIAVQFLHWFNPLVRVGLQRLRSDRELVCDAMVVERLERSARLGYAQVLLRLTEAISNGPIAFPSAVPVVGRASEIKSRVIMIKHYRKSGPMARVATVACVLVLGFLTFTRAADREPQAEPGLTMNMATNASASLQKISAIELRYVGPKVVKEKEVSRRIRVKLGDAYKPADVDDDLRALYSTGLFYNIHVSTELSPKGIALVYNVQCNPRIAKLRFTGNSKFGDAQLQKLIRSKVGDVFNERKIFSDTQAIQRAYSEAGSKGTGAKYSYEIDQETGKASIVFEITEKN